LLLALLEEQNLKRAFLLAHVAGAAFLGSTCHWLVDVVRIHGGLSTPLAYLALLAFLLVYPTVFGFFGAAVAWVARRSRPWALASAPILWVAEEYLRTYWITGFPWNLLGYAVGPEGLRQAATLTGVYGLSFLAVATSSLLAWLLIEPRRRAAQFALAGWVVAVMAGNWLAAPPPVRPATRTAVLIQPNVPLDEAGAAEWAPWRNPARLFELVELTVSTVREQAPSGPATTLVLWPENSAPFYFERDAIFRAAMERMARETRAYVIFGSVNFADAAETQPKNSAVLLDPEGHAIFDYDKIHLVPFGEYVPAWAFPNLIGKITHEAGNFVPGADYRTARTSLGGIGIFICYEAVFPDLVRRLVPEGEGVLVTISNDAWFGTSAAATQHLEMARLRAIETRRYLLRATNDGFTVIVDPYGRVVERIARGTRGTLVGKYDVRGERTPYTRAGDAFAWACVLLAFAGMAGLKTREKVKSPKAIGKGQK
jgi:apolipoprotein N-acyltransferase